MNITVQVMTFTDVSPGYHHAVETAHETAGDERGIDAAGAHHPYHADRRGILYPGNTGKVCACIGTPVAQKRKNSWFEFFGHCFSPFAGRCLQSPGRSSVVFKNVLTSFSQPNSGNIPKRSLMGPPPVEASRWYSGPRRPSRVWNSSSIQRKLRSPL